MRKKIIWVIVLIIVFVLFLMFYNFYNKTPLTIEFRDNSDEISNIFEGEMFTVGTVISGPPYSHRSALGEQIGYNVDVLNLLSSKLHIDFTLIEISPEEATEKLLSKEVDLILGLQYNPALSDTVKYSRPFIENMSRIFVKSTNMSINNFDDLTGKKVAVYKNDPSLRYVSTLSDVRIFKTESIEDAATMLRYGTVDAWVGNDRESIYLLQNLLFSNSIKMVGEGVETFPSAIASLKTNSTIIDVINIGIEDISDSDELETIENRWFGEIFTNTDNDLKRYLFVASLTAGCLTIIVLIIIRINQMLKKEVEKRTREISIQKKLSEEILQSLSDGVVTIDENKNILSLNDKIIEILGEDETQSIIGTNICQTFLINIVEQEYIEKCIEGNEKIIGIEKKLNTRENEFKIYNYNINPILLAMEDGSEKAGATISISDNTENIILKERMMTADKLQSIGRMTAGVAHELRNPLTSIDMYIKILPQKYDNSEFRDQMIQDLPREINRINEIVENLLNISRTKKPKKEMFNLSKEISGIIRLVKMQISHEEIKIVQEIDNRILIKFDKNQFTQVCLNILSNSIDELKSKKDGIITITGKKISNRVSLCFEDNGSGIPEDSLDSIFEPFYTTKENGNGIGLSIVNELVIKNDGIIRAYNSVENTPVFELSLSGVMEND